MKGKIKRFAIYIYKDGEEYLVDECRSETKARDSKVFWESRGWKTVVKDRSFNNMCLSYSGETLV